MKYIRVRTKPQLEYAVKESGADALLCPLALINEDTGSLQVFIDLPDILRENAAEDVAKAFRAALSGSKKISGAVIKNIDEIGLVKELAPQLPVIADSFLYAYNDEAAAFLKQNFRDIKFMASDELTDAESAKLAEKTIYKIYGRQRVMFTAQDISRNYGLASDKALLSSQKGDRLIAVHEDFGYTTVFNEEPTSMLGREISFEGDILIDLTTEARGPETDGTGFGHHFKGID